MTSSAGDGTGETGAAVAGALVPPLLVGALKQTSFGYVCLTYRVLAAEGTLTGHLEALSAELGFTVGDITVRSYLYFLGAPTLNFQTAYPRVPHQQPGAFQGSPVSLCCSVPL